MAWIHSTVVLSTKSMQNINYITSLTVVKALASSIPNIKFFTASVFGRGNENKICDVSLG